MSITDIYLRAGRPRCTEREPTELQARRRRPRAFFNEIERKIPGLLIAVLFIQHFEAVHNGTRRTDQVVAYARAQKCGEVECIKSHGGGHENVSVRARSRRKLANPDSRIVLSRRGVHRSSSICQERLVRGAAGRCWTIASSRAGSAVG